MARSLAVIIAAAFITAPDLAVAQSKQNDAPVAASRFRISIDGVQKPKAKGLKSTGAKKGGKAKSYPPQNAWPKKSY